jgi:pimeloyl-ACP methyl ester carboxylesterase
MHTNRWLIRIGLLLGYVSITATLCTADADGTTPQFSALSSATRKAIDSRALQLPWQNNKIRAVDFGKNVAGWLVASTAMSPEEEFRRANEVYEAIVAGSRVVETPPAAADVLNELIDALPQRMRPQEFDFSLSVVDSTEWRVKSIGGGRLLISRAYLEALLANQNGGSARLAFVLGHELGHLCRNHCRRGYQLLRLQEELAKNGNGWLEDAALKKGLEQTADVNGKIVTFRFNRAQVRQADLFAIHLCRNAGVNIEDAHDVLRASALLEQQAVVGGEEEPQRSSTTPHGPERAPVQPLRRLKWLREEQDGIVPGPNYGLLEFDADDGSLQGVPEGGLVAGERAVVCIHGMESDLHIYRPLMRLLSAADEAQRVRVFGFQYPSDASLARIGRFLTRELERTCESARDIDFVCHSAGGLVFRYFAEVEHGEFRRAILQGTPNFGSDLAKLRPLLEARQFLGDLKLGYPTALEQAIIDGRGQISFDLQPESLFLTYLNRSAGRAIFPERYTVMRGKALKRRYVVLAEGGLVLARHQLKQQASKLRQSQLLRESVAAKIDLLRMPDEMTAGDLAVTLESALLPGAAAVKTYPLHHIELPTNRAVMAATVRILLEN